MWLFFATFNAWSSLDAVASGPAIWLVPAFAVVSTLWSMDPSATLRFSLQFIATVACAVIAARHIAPRRFVSATLCGLLVPLLLSLAYGRYTYDPFSGAVVFVGVFGSKNALAGAVAVLLLSASAVLLDRNQPALMRATAFASFFAAAPVLLAARSATSLVTSVFAIAVLLGWYAFSRLATQERALLACAVAVVTLPLLAATVGVADEGARRFVEDYLGRDVTLTGRTTLWEKAAEQVADRPLLGQGYQAFWRHGSADAEGLWRYFHITGRSGFNFHNLYVEYAVALGLPGAALLAVVSAYALVATLLWGLEDRSMPSAFFCAFMAYALVRSFVELELFGQFGMMPVIFCAAMRYGLDRPLESGARRRLATPR